MTLKKNRSVSKFSVSQKLSAEHFHTFHKSNQPNFKDDVQIELYEAELLP